MSDLAAFTGARLDELETADWHVLDCSGMPREDGHCCDAQRWLVRDVASKRSILAEHRHSAEKIGDRIYGFGCDICHGDPEYGKPRGGNWCGTVLALAAVWGDHPDYDPDGLVARMTG
jgi:mono/diheme cytochrome c family protein